MLDGSNGERDTIYRGREKGTTRARTKTTFPDRQRESLEMRLESIRIHLLLLGIPSSLPFLFIASISLLLNGGMAAGVSSDGGIWEMGVSSSLRILLTFIQGLGRLTRRGCSFDQSSVLLLHEEATRSLFLCNLFRLPSSLSPLEGGKLL